MNYPVLKLKKGRERSVLHRHPWIFSGAIEGSVEAGNGDIVQVQDYRGERLAFGFYSTQSQIACRIFHFGHELLTIDALFWQQKMAKAYQLRERFVVSEHTNAYRLIHAEGDDFPGLIVDIYGEVAVVQLLIKGVEKILPVIAEGLYAYGVRAVYLNIKEVAQRIEQVELQEGWYGSTAVSSEVEIKENSLRFIVDVEQGQKTGFFLDQRDNRHLLGRYSRGMKVLNTFSYTGGFSIYALAHGAELVHSVDIAPAVLETAARNVALNSIPEGKHEAFAMDGFKYLEKETPQDFYDIIVLDPPAFAKNARAVPNAMRGYKALNLLAFKRIKKGGLLFTFSCSGNIDKDLFRKAIFAAAADARRKVRILHQLTQPIDHPINIYHPEGEYLKGLVLYVE
jgi:23S rRNA (cytosine1962-C5)-methyltransferase